MRGKKQNQNHASPVLPEFLSESEEFKNAAFVILSLILSVCSLLSVKSTVVIWQFSTSTE
jgi:hypothetical protein